MFGVLFLSLIIGITGGSIGCSTNLTCLEKETCCQTKNGLSSCCPIENGICCSDGLHCCFQGDQCSSNGTCLSSHSNHIYNGFLSKIIENQLETIQCPDGSQCSDNETCCELSSGQYACCPIRDAVCCSDHIHCCPKDHQCDPKKGRCTRKLDQLKDIQCPDGLTVCPDDFTCCPLASSGYACCPLADAVCCSDHTHCCPHGQVCDMEHRRCVSQISIPWFTKVPSIPIRLNLTKVVRNEILSSKQILLSDSSEEKQQDLNNIICPDKNVCAEETTCCQRTDGEYGCCPYPDGNCCSDKSHCCPHGYSCDESGTRCIRKFEIFNQTESFKLKLMKKLILKNENEDQLCPDNITKCFLNSTCCPNKHNNSLSYSCCPYSKGVCCGSNGSVCCPNGYDCDEQQLSCQLRDDRSLILRNLLSVEDLNQCQTSNIVCSNDQTCCSTNTNTFACCPYLNGQCCADGEHCCPNGTTCDSDIRGCL